MGEKVDHEFVLGHAFWNPYAEGDRCQFYQFPHGHCGAPRAMHERHAFTHYCGDEMCMDPTECSVCGLPRSAHATPPRSELADQLEALMREVDRLTGWPRVEARKALSRAAINALPEILTALRRTR